MVRSLPGKFFITVSYNTAVSYNTTVYYAAALKYRIVSMPTTGLDMGAGNRIFIAIFVYAPIPRCPAA